MNAYKGNDVFIFRRLFFIRPRKIISDKKMNSNI